MFDLSCPSLGTYGAGDPNSGSSALDEIVRVFGEMLSKGWKPLRPILIASWDGKCFYFSARAEPD